jgi:hypothetical protein
MSESVVSVEENVESWGRVESLVDDLAGSGKASQQAVRSVGDRLRKRTAADSSPKASSETNTVVLGSGNLGLIYLMEPDRLCLEDITARYPALLAGLVEHPGVGFVAVMSREYGPVVIGPSGTRQLNSDEVNGDDPLEPFGLYTVPLIAAATSMPQAPDVYVNSAVDPSTQEISAFEDLVGAHGGLGGWQDRGMLIAPVALLDGEPRIVGAEQLHLYLVAMLEQLGHRGHLREGERAT